MLLRLLAGHMPDTIWRRVRRSFAERVRSDCAYIDMSPRSQTGLDSEDLGQQAAG